MAGTADLAATGGVALLGFVIVNVGLATRRVLNRRRMAAWEAANALWPGVFERSEFVGVPGRARVRRRLDDKTLHHFPRALRARVEEAGHVFVPSWAQT